MDGIASFFLWSRGIFHIYFSGNGNISYLCLWECEIGIPLTYVTLDWLYSVVWWSLIEKKKSLPPISIKECIESQSDLKGEKPNRFTSLLGGEARLALKFEAACPRATSHGAAGRAPAPWWPGLCSLREMRTTYLCRLSLDALKLLSSSLGNFL